MSFSYSPKIVTENLVLCLDAANNKSYTSGSTIWNDLSKRGLSGTLINGPTYNSGNGGNIVFDGTNDYVSFNTVTLDLSKGFTALAFVKWNTFLGEKGVFSLSLDPVYINIWSSSNNDNSAYIRWETYAGADLYSNTLVQKNNITCIAGTHDGTSTFGGFNTGKIYINGVLDNSASMQTANGITGQFILGQHVQYLNGSIYYFSFYNRALSATEIYQNYNALKSRYGL